MVCLPPQTLQICAMFWKALQTVTKGWRAELVIAYYNKGCIPLPRQKIPSALCMSWVPGLRRTSGPSIVSDIFLGTSRRYLTISSYCNLCEFDVPTSGQKQIYCHSWRSLVSPGLVHEWEESEAGDRLMDWCSVSNDVDSVAVKKDLSTNAKQSIHWLSSAPTLTSQ